MSVFSHDRRHFPRRRLKSLAYIDLGSDSGGIVLNVSEGGLALHSAVALNRRPLPSIRFQLPDSPAWVTAHADIAWINATRKQAGIRFAGLPDDARRQIREWVASWSAEDSGAPPLSETMELASLTLGDVPETRAAAPSREPEGVEHKLRLHFAHRPPPVTEERTTPAARGIWWSFVAVIGSLAIASFAFGWFAGRGKLSVLPRMLEKVTGSAVAHARGKSASALVATLDAANAASIAAPGTPAAAASLPAAAAAAGHVSVTAQGYLPMPVPAANGARKPVSLRMGYIERRVNPAYPAQALAQGIQGTVVLRATFGPNGALAGISAVSGPPPLVAAAENAVRAWRYAPTLLNGHPVQTEQNVTITFSMPQPHSLAQPH